MELEKRCIWKGICFYVFITPNCVDTLNVWVENCLVPLSINIILHLFTCAIGFVSIKIITSVTAILNMGQDFYSSHSMYRLQASRQLESRDKGRSLSLTT